MPISKTIIDSISKLDSDKEVKELMLTILEKEDNGIKKYKNEYNSLISDFIKGEGKECPSDGNKDR